MHTPGNKFCLPPKSQILAVFSSPTKNYFLLLPRYPLAIFPPTTTAFLRLIHGRYTVDTR